MAAGLLWAGCAAAVAVRTSERGEAARALESRDGVTVAFWSDFSPETHEGLGEEMVACITSAIRSSLPGVRLVPEDDFYRTAFPGRKPGEVLLNAVALATFFQQTEFRQRVAALGVTRLILVGGETRHRGEIRGGAGGAQGAGIAGVAGHFQRESGLTASIFELGMPTPSRVEAVASGRGWFVWLIPLPLIPLGQFPGTQTAACEKLGEEVVRALQGQGVTEGEARD